MKEHVLNSLRRAIRQIESDLGNTVSLNDISDAAHLSPYHFSRLFKSATGKSVMEYLRRRRLSYSARLLTDGDEPILEIAEACGYGSHEAFTRAFKKAFGIPPAEYRRTANQLPLSMQRRITMPTMAETIHAAETLLQDKGYSAVTLEPSGQGLSGKGWPTVIRTRVYGQPEIESVIIRTFKDWAPFDPDDPNSPAVGLFAEWAALEFLNERLPGVQQIATLLAGDRDLGVLVMSDFGQAPTLDEILLRSSRTEVERYLRQLAKVLARIHGASIGQEQAYRQIYANLGPLPKDTSLQRYLDQSLEVLDQLEIEMSSEDQALVSQVTSFVLTPNEWTGLQHLEPGADNLIVVDGEIRLIDFEGSSWRNVLRDVAFPSMASGHLGIWQRPIHCQRTW